MAKISASNKYVRDSIQNVQTNEITISEDKLRIKLDKQIKRVKNSTGSLNYLGMFITCVGVLATAELKEIHGITPDMWKTVFFIVAVFCFILFVIRGFNALFNGVTVDTIVNDIKTTDFPCSYSFINKIKKFFNNKTNTDLAIEEEVVK